MKTRLLEIAFASTLVVSGCDACAPKPDPVDAVLHAPHGVRDADLDAIRRNPSAHVPQLVKILDLDRYLKSDETRRIEVPNAIVALVRAGGEDGRKATVELLDEALEKETSASRARDALATGLNRQTATPSEIETLRALDRELGQLTELRNLILVELGNVGSPAAKGSVLRYFDALEPSFRTTAAHYLITTAPDDAAVLEKLRTTRADPALRRDAIVQEYLRSKGVE